MILTNTAKNALLNGLKTLMNQGTANLNFYDSMGNLLAQCIFDNNDGVITTGQLRFIPSGQTSVAKSGTLASAKLYADSGDLLADSLSVGIAGDIVDVIVDNINVQVGGYVTLVSVVFQF